MNRNFKCLKSISYEAEQRLNEKKSAATLRCVFGV